MGTLIRNENLESNFLTLGIRFQFKVPHLGEGFKFNISHEYGKPIVAIFNNLIYIQFSIYIYVIFFYSFNLIFIFMQYF